MEESDGEEEFEGEEGEDVEREGEEEVEGEGEECDTGPSTQEGEGGIISKLSHIQSHCICCVINGRSALQVLMKLTLHKS